ncbi:MAG: protein dehydratase [Rhizobiales bacterium]|nr:protein dehydratase [Hyphomicrobiales bacterium]MBA68325.1 protein dehydratase [Hyphomicrobiales bacterium]|tara:strand:- start:19 stop:867 length:849 start_codon:yes stop_codon:yes gene_type:complete
MSGLNEVADETAWIGSENTVEDRLTQRLADQWRGALQFDGLAISPELLGVHWILGVGTPGNAELGADGHARKGEFLPPITLPRRMWASSELEFLASPTVNDEVTHRSRVEGIAHKTGRSGPLCFVTVDHAWSTSRGVLVREKQHIVYRDSVPPRNAAAPHDAPEFPTAQHSLEIACKPVHLFRFSALTYNSHRIHYDFPYATEVEGYAGLVVQGPLQASLLLNFARQVAGRVPRRFAFRGVAPLIADHAFALHANEDAEGLKLCVRDEYNLTTMTAVAEWDT